MLLVIALVVGFCIGAIGVGGILLIPSLILFADISIHQAAGTALFTFLFTGLYGTWLFLRRGSIDWRVSLPICLSAIVFSYAGAWVNSALGAMALHRIIAVVTITAGVYILVPGSRHNRDALDGHSQRRMALLLGIGATAGFGAGLSGAGGPLFSVPIMLLLGFAPLTAIGTGQVLQIAAASAGSFSNLRYGTINFDVSWWLIAGELIGVFVGVHIAHRARTEYLRAMVAGLCITVGGWMLL